MDKYVVAGEIIGIQLWGYDLRDLAETVGMPVAAFATLRALPVEVTLAPPILIVGFLIGLFILFAKPDSLRPLEYLSGIVKYYMTPKTYYQNLGRNESLVEYQDVIITAHEDAKSDELVERRND